ncbi:hypothetical protein LINGRAHAP2_LOCUS17604 [Linum grandiflorum]
MHSSSKLVITLIISIVSISTLVEGKFPDTTILSGPNCTGKSTTKRYNDNVMHLLDTFVKDTKISRRNIYGDRQMNHSHPNRNPGSPTGESVCYQDLGRLDCFNCLFNAKGKLDSGCLHPVAASIKLQDCSIWFKPHP